MKRAAIKHEPAMQTGELLDKARIAYGPEDWDDEDLLTIVLELVTEDA